jgi:hypothetical protein
MGDPSQASQLVQAKAGFGRGGTSESLNTVALGADTSPALLMASQHA